LQVTINVPENYQWEAVKIRGATEIIATSIMVNNLDINLCNNPFNEEFTVVSLNDINIQESFYICSYNIDISCTIGDNIQSEITSSFANVEFLNTYNGYLSLRGDIEPTVEGGVSILFLTVLYIFIKSYRRIIVNLLLQILN